jgi:hypothetical protein
MNKKMPLMPWSSQLAEFKEHGAWQWIPRAGNLAEVQSIMYGMRGIVNSPPANITYEQAPGIRVMLDSFNANVDPKQNFAPDRYLDIIRAFNTLYRGLFDSQNWALAIGGTTIKYSAGVAADNKVYSLQKSLVETVRLTESSDQEESLSQIAYLVLSGDAIKVNRRLMRLLNTIDMNMMPINVHALRRSIPLINTMQMSLTFDEMMTELFNRDDTMVNPKDMAGFIRAFMVDPHGDMSDEVYNTLVVQFFRGNTGLEMVRPRFLANEIFNKSLLKSVYVSDTVSGPDPGPFKRGASIEEKAKMILPGFFRVIFGEVTHAGHTKAWTKILKPAAVHGLYTHFGPLLLEYILSNKPLTELDKAIKIDAAPLNTAADYVGTTYHKHLAKIIKFFLVMTPLVIKNLLSMKLDVNSAPDMTAAANVIKLIIGSNVVPGIMAIGPAAAAPGRFITTNGIKYANLLKGIVPPDAIHDLTGLAPAAYVRGDVDSSITSNSVIDALNKYPLLDAYGKPAPYNGTLNYTTGTNEAMSIVSKTVDTTKLTATVDAISKHRFDTYLIRNIMFASEMYRIIRYKLDKELKWYNPQDLVRSYSVLNDSLTERYGHQTDNA